MPFEMKFGQLYLCWGAIEVLYTKPELVKLHSHLRHPSIGKLYAVIKRERPHQVDESTQKLLEDITSSCETCQTFISPPQRFHVSLPPIRHSIQSRYCNELPVDRQKRQHWTSIISRQTSVQHLS